MTKESARNANPHVRFDEKDVIPATPRCGALPCKQQQNVVIRMGKLMVCLALVMCATQAVADNTGSVFMCPSSSILWRTAPGADFELPVFMPQGASSATLVVVGQNYRQEYTGLSDGMFSLSFPAAGSDDTENVYDLTLTFNDEAATTRSAKIGVVVGASSGDSAEATVRAAGSSRWHNVPTKALLPIPSGVDSLSINGTTADAGLYESPGWFYFLSQVGSTYDILLSGGGTPIAEATLLSISTGFKFIIK